MPNRSTFAVENTFTNGLITEATGLNFPEGACTETYDCEFDSLGAVRRRFGFDFENGYSTKTIDRGGRAISTYLWRNVNGDGDVTVLVLQVGSTLYFYETATSGNFSNGAVASTVALTPVSGASAGQVQLIEAQYSDGNGLLFVTHPLCDPQYVAYDIAGHTATATNVMIKIRDFEGAVADTYAVDERPTSTLAGLNVNHLYNLYNQGWNTTSLTAWDTAQTTMPSNADVMWTFADSSGNFDASNAAIARVVAGNTTAPKGHFVLTLSNQNRDTAAGTSGVSSTTTGTARPSTSAFFGGRVFYSGVGLVGFNSKIYFTQIVQRPAQYSSCYQQNDPTSEETFEILPDDGGVISIPESGSIIKLFVVPGGLAVFAARGVWFITGSSAIGFTANDYTIHKLATIETLSATSFVNVMGFPAWWNANGIYVMVAPDTSGAVNTPPNIRSLTDHKIRSFYTDISLSSKRYARGFFHPIDQHIRWIYNSGATVQVDNIYEFDRVLSYNTLTGAFYPWTVTSSPVKINSIVSSDINSKALSAANVVDASVNNVIDGSGNQVIAYLDPGTQDPYFDKYLVSYPDSGSYKFTFADKFNANYKDWHTYDGVGLNFTSYFITGYHAQFSSALKRFQTNWIRIYNRTTTAVAYKFQSIWDYATTALGTGRWSTTQQVTHTNTNYSTTTSRLKVRGRGIALQFKIESVPGEPFHIVGWGAQQVPNQIP